ncbi:PP2C family protein-serine/threonine phosphatase [Nocardioides marmotae]|uniref:SpoIIE family protein phosphatase n=1 Tax=Nocardioides marmotae TaxID=2663857 RepID=A0A6I3JGC1_9ACTN|nr:PP2C family protein-serine/threonine phosphatase [Nocardioides marmotae]MCR6033427.1 SpoIIE family protein phosphatase [Gordonia jinghuaiqii]MBC9734705.1 serine/threonine-protein phosphatase [Nocardioides marmotae]MTB85807.1 SpoIIE family protein phosphatase [Nocardioides marmotae]MTB97085.1 SpoIIE family protein phosphatase [Nocardioides marmotae]QKE00742.1 serine/threonine-protein phosphatase [Nocardioides marmotae]
MTAAYDARRVVSRRARVAALRRRVPRETRWAVGLVLGGVVLTALVAAFPAQMPLDALMLPLLLGSLVLGPRTLPWFVIALMLLLTVSLAVQESIDARAVGSVSIQFAMGFVVLLTSFRRSRLGVANMLGESMLVDLRDRILNQGGVPSLPAGWQVETALRSAGGTPFAGDFVVATRPEGTRRLEVVVVDVSGKGEQAGTRALLLSGAFGGLLGALPPDRFLPAANAYLLQQDWEEGFATAVHLSLDLDTGAYAVRTAGHPPAVVRAAGSGRWSVLASDGPVLGLIDEAVFNASTGHLQTGDALLLYTDGMVEEPRRDIELGIDRMLGEAESLLRGDFRGAADRLVAALGARDDDSAMVVVNRR